MLFSKLALLGTLLSATIQLGTVMLELQKTRKLTMLSTKLKERVTLVVMGILTSGSIQATRNGSMEESPQKYVLSIKRLE